MAYKKQYILQRTDNKGNVIVNKRTNEVYPKYYASSGGDRVVPGNLIHLADKFEHIGDAMRKAIELHKKYNKYFKIIPIDSINEN